MLIETKEKLKELSEITDFSPSTEEMEENINMNNKHQKTWDQLKEENEKQYLIKSMFKMNFSKFRKSIQISENELNRLKEIKDFTPSQEEVDKRSKLEISNLENENKNKLSTKINKQPQEINGIEKEQLRVLNILSQYGFVLDQQGQIFIYDQKEAIRVINEEIDADKEVKQQEEAIGEQIKQNLETEEKIIEQKKDEVQQNEMAVEVQETEEVKKNAEQHKENVLEAIEGWKPSEVTREIVHGLHNQVNANAEQNINESINNAEIREEDDVIGYIDRTVHSDAISKEEFANVNILVLKSILESLKGLMDEDNAFSALDSILNKLGDNDGVKNITENLKIIFELLQQNADDTSKYYQNS